MTAGSAKCPDRQAGMKKLQWSAQINEGAQHDKHRNEGSQHEQSNKGLF